MGSSFSFEEIKQKVEEELEVEVFHACSPSIRTNFVVAYADKERYEELTSNNFYKTNINKSNKKKWEIFKFIANGTPIHITMLSKDDVNDFAKQPYFKLWEKSKNIDRNDDLRSYLNELSGKTTFYENTKLNNEYSENEDEISSFPELLYHFRQRCKIKVKNKLQNSIRKRSWTFGERTSGNNNTNSPPNNGKLSTEENNPFSIIHQSSINKILSVIETSTMFYIISAYQPYNLKYLIQFSSILRKDQDSTLFIIYQIISSLHFAHQNGVIHGNLTPSNILLSNSKWIQLTSFHFPKEISYFTKEEMESFHYDGEKGTLFNLWRLGHVSNFDYLMALNRLAGRRIGYYFFHLYFDFFLFNLLIYFEKNMIIYCLFILFNLLYKLFI